MELRTQRELKGFFLRAPAPSLITGGKVEFIFARRQVCVLRPSIGAARYPLLVEAIQSIAELRALGVGEARSGVMNFQPPSSRSKFNRCAKLDVRFVGQQHFHACYRSVAAQRQPRRVDYDHALDRGEPESTVV